jgi:cell division protein FtsB
MGMMGCCGHMMHGPMSHFLSKKKQVQALEKYVKRLREEIEDIEEFIAELRSGK